MFTSWKDEAQSLYEQQWSCPEIAKKISSYFPDEPYEKIYNKVRWYLYSYNKARAQENSATEDKPVVVQNFNPALANACWDGSSVITFGVVSDTHINSVFTQLSHLHHFYGICSKIGIKDVYHVGDIDEGEQMRVGHQYECYNQGGDAHIDHIVRHYPCVPGITTHFITGNHDASIFKRCGMNIGEHIARRRDDMHYLGSDIAKVYLTENCVMELRHPWDGTSYAISYKPQKLVESMANKERPDILVIGHYHKQDYIWYKGVHTFQAGCFCAQTNFMKGKGIAAAVGGWIISIVVDKEGYLKAVSPTFIPYEDAIVDDYTNFVRQF